MIQTFVTPDMGEYVTLHVPLDCIFLRLALMQSIKLSVKLGPCLNSVSMSRE